MCTILAEGVMRNNTILCNFFESGPVVQSR